MTARTLTPTVEELELYLEETQRARPVERLAARYLAKRGLACGRLHCLVCTAHLAPGQQRFCSARCRARARSLRKQEMLCGRCGARQWVPRRALKSEM